MSAQAELPAQVGQLVEDIFGSLFPAALQTAVRLDIPDQLVDGPRTAEELAKPTGANGPNLERVLRFLAARGVFREDEDGRFHLTPLAGLLRAGAQPSLRGLVLMTADEVVWRVTEGLSIGVVKGTQVFEEIYGMGFFAYVERHPEFAALFHKGMSSVAGTEDPGVVDAYAFPPGATVVDVGGGRGGLLRTVLEKNDGLKGILYDRDAAVGDNLLAGPELAGRWTAVSGNLLESVPEGGDIYTIKHVLHNWSDENCVRILRNCRRAMAPDGRVLIVEAVIPRDNAPHSGKTIDLMMMSFMDGRERTREGFEAVLAEAGFRLARVVPTSSYASIVEAVPLES